MSEPAVVFSPNEIFREAPRDLWGVLQVFGVLCGQVSAGSIFLRRQGWSGCDFLEGPGATLAFAPLVGGGLAVWRRIGSDEEVFFYGEDGSFCRRLSVMPPPLLVPEFFMEPESPLISHLFNLLHHEYFLAKSGEAHPEMVATVEGVLQRWRREGGGVPLWRDPAAQEFWRESLRLERFSVLTWRERQRAVARLSAKRGEILNVKARVFGLMWAWFPLRMLDILFFFRRVTMRPRSNILGLLRLTTLDAALWFFHTVRNNIGYSIALAIYGPFTFYFITQPLNPKAMWAVGKVRSAYLDTTEQVTQWVGGAAVVSPLDSAAPITPIPVADPAPGAVSAAPEVVRLNLLANAWQQRLQQAHPAHFDFPVTTDFPEVDALSWQDRMSHFKGLQIALEERMVFAARMGRIEQIESQLLFPMTVRNAWAEISRYFEDVERKISRLDPESQERDFFLRELARAERARFYVWDKILRFNRDYRYIVMDAGKEHQYKDRYLGDPLFALVDLTESLQKHVPGFVLPGDYAEIKKMAAGFERNVKAVAATDLLSTLRAQSAIFAQKDPFDGREYRSYMARQWEILFLLQNKAQEASNFGLMAYTGSIRNGIYALQCLYANKRRDVFPNGPEGPRGSPEVRQHSSRLYQGTLALFQSDLVSIGPELAERLPFDLDFVQRKEIINDVRAFLEDREKLVSNEEKERDSGFANRRMGMERTDGTGALSQKDFSSEEKTQ